MPVLFIFAIILFIIGAAVAAWRLSDKSNAAPIGKIAVGVLCIAALLTVVSSIKSVGTKEVGVEIALGKTAGHLNNGPHLTWPWIQVHEMDAAIQTDNFLDGACIKVRIANQQTGCANLSIQWRIKQNSVDSLYQNYRSFEHVREALVTRKLTQAVNEALAGYNPLDLIVSGTGTSTSVANGSSMTLPKLSAKITTIMRHEIGSQINVLSTILSYISFDQETQSRINQLQQQVALTDIAKQEYQTNKAQASANAALAKSVNTSPNVLVAQCLSIWEAMVKAREPVPAGMSCWPGGGAAAVIANSSGSTPSSTPSTAAQK